MRLEPEDLLMNAVRPAGDGENATTNAIDNPGDLTGVLKQVGGSQSDNWNSILVRKYR